ncbi:hypothetical protein B0H14DRAFT_2610048 [Mycena olivaceomarginata]|nr:hypothetical protein B0H14DRAFT_2610048 [Mycena olivaceomarginata]
MHILHCFATTFRPLTRMPTVQEKKKIPNTANDKCTAKRILNLPSGIAAGDWARVHGWACEAGEGRGRGSGYLAPSFWLPARVYLHDAPQGRRRVVPRRRRAPATGTRVAASTRWNGRRQATAESSAATRYTSCQPASTPTQTPSRSAQGTGFSVREYAPHLTTEWARASRSVPGNTIPPWSPVEESPSQREVALLGGSRTAEKQKTQEDVEARALAAGCYREPEAPGQRKVPAYQHNLES